MSNNCSICLRHDVFPIRKSNYYEDIFPVIAALFDSLSSNISDFYSKHDTSMREGIASFFEESQIYLSEISGDRDVAIFLELVERWLNTNDILTFGIEYYYIDRDFRDSYYLHYSEKHKEIERYCKRLYVFVGDFTKTLNKVHFTKKNLNLLRKSFAGSIVITPLHGRSIGRTLLNPDYFFNKGFAFIRKTNYSIYYKGYEFNVCAFPFRMQDQITTSCAEVTITNVLDYYSRRYTDYRYITPSDIHLIAKNEQFDRHIPSRGLSYQLISRILYLSGFSPKFYTPRNIENTSVKHLLSYYIESGIPVAVGVNDINKENGIGHSILLVGHGECNLSLSLVSNEETPISKKKYINSADLSDDWIVQDDAHAPYCIFEQVGDELIRRKCIDGVKSGNSKIPNFKKITFIVVPLYKRMYMDAIKAQDTVLSILDADDENLSPYTTVQGEGTIIFRLFLASSRHLKSFRISSIKHRTMCQLYQETPLPQFVWVCELYTSNGFKRKKAFGEILLDATYSGPNLMDSCLMINYPDRHLAHFFDDSSIFEIEKSQTGSSSNSITNELEFWARESSDWVRFKGVDEFEGYSNLQ